MSLVAFRQAQYELSRRKHFFKKQFEQKQCHSEHFDYAQYKLRRTATLLLFCMFVLLFYQLSIILVFQFIQVVDKYLYVYILKCSDGSYYTGITNDSERRFHEHQQGENPTCYTFSRRPVELVYLEQFQYYHQAIAWEKQIKGWTRAKKKALIQNNWQKLKELSQCSNDSHSKNYQRLDDSMK